MKKKPVPFYDEDYWLEYLEQQLEPNLYKDLQLLLRGSIADREIYESLQAVRMLVKASDDVAMPEDGLYYSRLQNRIMAALNQEIEPQTKQNADLRSTEPSGEKIALEAVVKELTRKFSPRLKTLQES